MLPCVLPMIIHRQTWIQNKITDSKKTVSDTDTITCWDQRKNVQITGTKQKMYYGVQCHFQQYFSYIMAVPDYITYSS
jgi:hypothetical protein